MGTRSDIIVHLSDDTWARIYCHWDGHIEHNGRILHRHYNSQEKAEALIALGDLSVLGEKIGIEHPFEWRSRTQPGSALYKRYEKMCLAYGRDRKERDAEAVRGASIYEVWPPADTWTEFTYVWDQGKWWVGNPDESSQTVIALSDAIASNLDGKQPIKSAVKAPWGVIGQR